MEQANERRRPPATNRYRLNLSAYGMPPALSPTGFDCKRALDVEARLVSERGPGLSPFTRLSLFYFNKSDFSRIHRISPRETKIITQRTTLSMKFRTLPPFRRRQTYSDIQKPVQWT